MKKHYSTFHDNYIRIRRNSYCITCEEAAYSRAIPLSQELKTLIVVARNHYFAIHICGNMRANIRNLKHTIRTKDIRFASKEELLAFGLLKGLINPWNTTFCVANCICTSLFNQDILATNNFSFYEGIFFKPQYLLQLRNPVIGNFGIQHK